MCSVINVHVTMQNYSLKIICLLQVNMIHGYQIRNISQDNTTSHGEVCKKCHETEPVYALESDFGYFFMLIWTVSEDLTPSKWHKLIRIQDPALRVICTWRQDCLNIIHSSKWSQRGTIILGTRLFGFVKDKIFVRLKRGALLLVLKD